MELQDKLTDIKTTTDESIENYYTDVYNPWSTKEQLSVWQEVAQEKIHTWTIDTSDSGLEKVSNVYNLSVANPDWKIISIEITWKWETKRGTFKIWFFWNTTLAYETLETELQTMLWIEYTITYVSWTNYSITRFDWLPISINRPNLARQIDLSWFDDISVIDVIVDWITITLDWPTLAWSSSDAIEYLKDNLSSSLYYFIESATNLVIARKDLAIPVISKTQYNKYTYALGYRYTDTPSTWQYLDYVATTIDWVEYKNYANTFSNSRVYRWYEFVSNLAEIPQTISGIVVWPDWLTSLYLWFEFVVKQTCKLTTITRAIDSTAPKVTLYSWATALQTEDFSSWSATFNYTLTPWTYSLKAHNDWASYTEQSSNWVQKTNYWEYITIDVSTAWNIASITTEFVLDTDLIIDSAISLTYWDYSYLYLNKADYSAFTISSINHYTNPASFPDDTFATTNVTTNHLADITISTYTEITISLTLSWFNYYIRTNSYPNNIKISAISSAWTSEWEYIYPNQSCTARYWTTTEFVDNKIFKTNADNYWHIVQIKKWWFIISFTTDRSNKLNYTCKQTNL